MTDRELLVGVLSAILGLGEKITGQQMGIRIQTEDGPVNLRASYGSSLWITRMAVTQPSSEATPGVPDAHAGQTQSPCASQKPCPQDAARLGFPQH